MTLYSYLVKSFATINDSVHLRNDAIQLVHRQHSLLVQPGLDGLMLISVVILRIEVLEFENVRILQCGINILLG